MSGVVQRGIRMMGVILLFTGALGASEGSRKPKTFSESYCDAQVAGLQKRLSLSASQTRQVRQILSAEDWTGFFTIAGRLESFDSSMRAIYASGKTPEAGEVQRAVQELSPLCRQGLGMMMRRSKRIQDLLTSRQRAIYEPEVRELEVNTAELTERLSRWERGRFHAGELQTCFGRKIDSPQAWGEDASSRTYTFTSSDFWDLYVQTFIEAFQLDRGQRTLAYSLLGEMKSQAQAYTADHRAEYLAIENALADLKNDSARQNTTREEWLMKKEKLDRAILEMFERLRERLMAIPTQDQIKSAACVLNPQKSSQPVTVTTQPAH